MANTPESIQKIRIGNEEHPIDAKAVGGKTIEQIGTLVTSIDGSSTDSQYPSAKCIYEMIYGPVGEQVSNNWNTSDTWNENELW